VCVCLHKYSLDVKILSVVRIEMMTCLEGGMQEFDISEYTFGRKKHLSVLAINDEREKGC